MTDIATVEDHNYCLSCGTKFNVDVYEVMKGVGLDFRINPRFLQAGVGFLCQP